MVEHLLPNKALSLDNEKGRFLTGRGIFDMGDDHFTSESSNSGRHPYRGEDSHRSDSPKTIAVAIDEFIDEQRARGLLPTTIQGMRLYLDPLAGPEIGLDPDTQLSDITRIDVLRYLEKRFDPVTRGRSYSVSTHRNAIRQLNSFFRWAHALGYTEKFTLEGLRPPRPDQKLILPLTDHEIVKVFETFETLSKHKLRNGSVFALMLDSGIRRSEVARLKKSDIDLVAQTVRVYGKKKERVVGFGTRTAELLSLYAGHFSSKRPGAGSDHLFLTRLGEPITDAAVTGIFNWLKQPSGIRRINAHITRHTFATRFLQRGGDPFTLRMLLGHSSLRMVATYVRTAETTDPGIMKDHSIMDETKALGGVLKNFTRSTVVQQTLMRPTTKRDTRNREFFINNRKRSE